MVNVKYIGDAPEINVRVLTSLERNWKKNEVREFSDEQARVLEVNNEFEIVGSTKAKKPEFVPVVEEEHYDDVVVDDEEEKDENIVEE